MGQYILKRYSNAKKSDESIEHFDVRELMMVHPDRRDVTWLRRMLGWAVAIELSTIPLYLFARWSVSAMGSEVVKWMKSITLQEMGHMGTALNLLKGVGGACSLIRAAPRFPRCGLPGGVHPGLRLSLQPLSKHLVQRTFMEIEKPDVGDYEVCGGQTYPTIGAFYLAICDGLLCSGLDNLDMNYQQEFIDEAHGVVVRTAPTVADAIQVIRGLVSEGEGTTASPETMPGSDVLAHYWIFSQIHIGRKLVKVARDGPIRAIRLTFLRLTVFVRSDQHWPASAKKVLLSIECIRRCWNRCKRRGTLAAKKEPNIW